MRSALSDRLVPCWDESNSYPAYRVVDFLLRRNYVSNIGKLSLSDAMLWRSSIDHGENHEPGKSRCTRGEISRAMKIDGQWERNMLTWDPQLENSIKHIISR